jgi:hypothetical protein
MDVEMLASLWQRIRGGFTIPETMAQTAHMLPAAEVGRPPPYFLHAYIALLRDQTTMPTDDVCWAAALCMS